METESLDRADGRLWQNAFSFTDDTYSHGMRSMHSQAFGFSHFRWSIHSEMISHRITRFPFTNRAKAFCDVANLSCFFLEKKMLFRLNRKSYEDIYWLFELHRKPRLTSEQLRTARPQDVTRPANKKRKTAYEEILNIQDVPAFP